MACCIRTMSREDVSQVTQIDREAFPTQLPPPDYYHELNNKLARYIVVSTSCETSREGAPDEVPKRGISGLAFRLRHAFNNGGNNGEPDSGLEREDVLGFAGFWIMADEAHITSIAVWEKHRGQGIGELLIMSLAELARELKASMVTLEVRVSNTPAQELYRKYGFIEVGVRRGYYTDNGEDGLLMTLDNLGSEPVAAHLEKLKQAHSQKWGKDIALYQIARS